MRFNELMNVKNLNGARLIVAVQRASALIIFIVHNQASGAWGTAHNGPAGSDALKDHKPQSPSEMPTAVGLRSVRGAFGFWYSAAGSPGKFLLRFIGYMDR